MVMMIWTGGLCFLAPGLALFVFLAGLSLRLAINLYNWLSGARRKRRRRDAVPDPDMQRAMVIILAILFFNAAILILFNGIGAWAGKSDETFRTKLVVVYYLLAPIVEAVMLAGLLPTTYARAFGVVLCHALVFIIPVEIIAFITFLKRR